MPLLSNFLGIRAIYPVLRLKIYMEKLTERLHPSQLIKSILKIQVLANHLSVLTVTKLKLKLIFQKRISEE